jgi:hypothetical protein
MARGGKRPGAGRLPGSKDPQALKKERVLEALRQRIFKLVCNLFSKSDPVFAIFLSDRGLALRGPGVDVRRPSHIRIFLAW